MEGDKPTRASVLSLLTEFMRTAARKSAEIPLGPHRFNIEKAGQGKYSIQDSNKQLYPISEETAELISSVGNSLSSFSTRSCY